MERNSHVHVSYGGVELCMRTLEATHLHAYPKVLGLLGGGDCKQNLLCSMALFWKFKHVSKHFPTSSFSVAVISHSHAEELHTTSFPQHCSLLFFRPTLTDVHSSNVKRTHAQVHGHIQTGTPVCTDAEIHACKPPAGLHNVTLVQ